MFWQRFLKHWGQIRSYPRGCQAHFCRQVANVKSWYWRRKLGAFEKCVCTSVRAAPRWIRKLSAYTRLLQCGLACTQGLQNISISWIVSIFWWSKAIIIISTLIEINQFVFSPIVGCSHTTVKVFPGPRNLTFLCFFLSYVGLDWKCIFIYLCSIVHS